MDKKAKRNEEQLQTGREWAQNFVHSLGKAMQAPQPLALSGDGICGFTLLSGGSVIFLYYEKKFSLSCQLSRAIKDGINPLRCYREILRHSFYLNPDQDGIAHVSPEGDQLIVNWHLLMNRQLPQAEIFAEHLSHADSYWQGFLQERGRT